MTIHANTYQQFRHISYLQQIDGSCEIDSVVS